jgi:glutathione S-transferase/RNA polymerase-associated protein
LLSRGQTQAALCVEPEINTMTIVGFEPSDAHNRRWGRVDDTDVITVMDYYTSVSLTAPPLSIAEAASLVEKGLFKREYRDHHLEWMIKSGGLEVVVKGLQADNIRFSPTFG